MALTQEKRNEVSSHAHRIRASKIPTEHDHFARVHQTQLDTRVEATIQKPAAVRDLYVEACAGNSCGEKKRYELVAGKSDVKKMTGKKMCF